MRKKSIYVIIFLVVVLLAPVFSSAQNNPTNNIKSTNKSLFQFIGPARETEGPSYFGMFIKTIIVLGVFGVGIYYIFKYISKKQGLSFPQVNIMKIVSSLPVGTNRFIQLIEVGDKYYLIGSSENQVNMLTEITDKETINRINVIKNKSPEKMQTTSFMEFLNEIIGGMTKKFHSKDKSSFLNRQKDRLKNMKFK